MLLTFFLVASVTESVVPRALDPCSEHSALRASFESFPAYESIKTNILYTAGKSLAFHASAKYRIQAREPYAKHSTQLNDDLSIRISDAPRSGVNRPCILLSIAEFADQISVWQDALLDHLKGRLESLSAAKVLAIDGEDPFVAIFASAAITGRYQSPGWSRNGFFSSYQRGDRDGSTFSENLRV
ncbi:hypothetical protein A7U60_g795 [Sanghuangporus baumii]|uniref:Uncharacterized protein n=1 Tax=Sanghuangporus baumii TaxID=108892 RepID=A0A9Q5I570_SANBA|nr:hypothetical protein A7U60_g795 [Sanghuangporus baumii]